MKALIFIKNTHKKYLDKSKINNNIFDDNNCNYEYYFNKYYLYEKLLEYNESPYKNKLYITEYNRHKLPIKDDLIIPIEFNKFNFIHIPDYNLIFNNYFNNIYDITGRNIIINGIMENLNNIVNFNNLIINNKTSIKYLFLNNEYWIMKYDNKKIIFNYEIEQNITIINLERYDFEISFINNTNKDIILIIKNIKYNRIEPIIKNNIVVKKGFRNPTPYFTYEKIILKSHSNLILSLSNFLN